MNDYLELRHHGIKGMKWGVRRTPEQLGHLKNFEKSNGGSYDKDDVVFISGKVKYDEPISDTIKKELDKMIKSKSKIIIGDAPGADTRIQDYLSEVNYKNVVVYTTDDKVRNNKGNWSVEKISSDGYKEEREIRRQKDIAMSKSATKGFVVSSDDDRSDSATSLNVQRLIESGKPIQFYDFKSKELHKSIQHGGIEMNGDTNISELLEDTVEHKYHEDGAIDKDFYEKLKSWIREELDGLERVLYSKPWFGEAWQKYRKHVLDNKKKDIREPGYIFKEYINNDESLTQEELEHLWVSDGYVYYELQDYEKCVCHRVKNQNGYLQHDAKFEQEHPRGKGGKFVTKGGIGSLSDEEKIKYRKRIEGIVKESGVSERKATEYVLGEAAKKEQKQREEEQRQRDEANKKAVEEAAKKQKEYVDAEIKTVTDLGKNVGGVMNSTRDLVDAMPGADEIVERGKYPELSEDEMRKRINRINLERQYSDAVGDTKVIQTGKGKAKAALKILGETFELIGAAAGAVLVIRNLTGKSSSKKTK